MEVEFGLFVWDADKERINIERHGLGFAEASRVFEDPERLIAEDLKHSREEDRFFCVGRTGDAIATVRFTRRGEFTRIIGAGYWRKGRKLYEEKARS